MKVLVGLSGGVDSSVAALLLKEQGHEVVGATMRLWKEGRYKGGSRDACFGPNEIEDVKAATAFCEKLGIEYRTFDCADAYERDVLEPYRAAFLAGRTPNPCVRCNAALKFGALPQLVAQAGVSFDCFATGHYARVDKQDGRVRLLRPSDRSRDQTYFLYRLKQEQLAKVIFPLGTLEKTEVRRIAREHGLDAIADKPDSQDFYSGDRDELIGRPDKPGNIVDASGKVLGKHTGFWKYTIGQRKGLGIGGVAEPLYVIGLNSCANQVIVGPRAGSIRHSLVAAECNWVSIPEPAAGESFECSIRIRSMGEPHSNCRVVSLGGGRVRAEFPEGLFGVTPGQSSVFYSEDLTLGGGFIECSE